MLANDDDDGLLSVLNSQANHSAVLDNKLNDLVNSSSQNLSLGLARLEILRSQLGHAENQSQDMASLLAEPSMTAARMAAKLSQLDIEHIRIKHAGEYVDNVQQLCTCISGLHNSMDKQDWEAAAKYIHQANSLGHDLITSQFAEAMVPTIQVPESPAVALENASESLASLFLREFDKAATVKDMERLTRFFKLLPLIGKNAQGLESYGRFVCGIISSQSRNLMQNRAEGPNVYGLMFSRLFESIANIIEQHTPLVIRYYGKLSMVPVIERIQVEADIQGGIIIDTFIDERQIKRRINQVKSYPFDYLVQTFTSSSSAPPSARNSMDGAGYNDDSVDVKEIDQLLNECSLMISRWSLYCLFVARKFKNKIKEQDNGGEDKQLQLPEIMITSALNQKVKQQLNPCFETMSTFFLRRSVEKASQLEEYPDLDSPDISAPVTSMVDDVMYILDASLARVVSTGHAQLICNVISNFRRVLESDYVGIVQQKLRNEPMTRQQVASSSNPPSSPTDKQIRTFALLLNTLDISLVYIKRITEKVKKTLGDRLLLGQDSQQVDKALSGMASAFESRTNELINDGMHIFFNQAIGGKLRAMLQDSFRDAVYIGEQQADSLVQRRFSDRWLALMDPIMPCLSEANQMRLLAICCSNLSRLLERRIWDQRNKLDELGAIRLDRDISGIVSIVTEKAYSQRERFLRIAQLVMAINMDKEEEEASDIKWVITEAERRRAYQLRVDSDQV